MAAVRDAPRRHPGRQLRPRADGPVRRGPAPGRAPAPDQLVPLPRPRVAAVPPLPEPPVDGHRARWGSWSVRTGPSPGACTCCCRCGRSASTGGPGAPVGPLDRGDGRRGSRRSSSPRSGSASRPRRTCGSDSACGRSCGRCGPCPWPGASAGRPSARGAGTGRPSLFASLTVMLHFETGYLAVLPLVLLPWLTPSAWRPRVVRAAVVLAGDPGGHGLGDGPGPGVGPVGLGQRGPAGHAARGRLRRPPGHPVAGHRRTPRRRAPARWSPSWPASGSVTCVVRFRRDERGRVLLVLLALSLVLSSGRTTFGPLVDLLPGSTDLFLRRFMMGVQLASLLLAGVGAATVGTPARGRVPDRWRGGAWARVRRAHRACGWRPGRVLGVLAVAWLAPALVQSARYDTGNATAIHDQVVDDGLDGPGSHRCSTGSGPRGTGGCTPGSPTIGAPASWSARFRCSSTWRARTSTKWATPSAPPR